jgi:hypothetical protein
MKQVSMSSYVPEVRRFDDSARCRISDITATTGGTYFTVASVILRGTLL